MLKSTVINALRQFIRQRPGIEPRNYGDWKSYRAESRSVTRDMHQAEELLRAVEWRDNITADNLIDAARHAYSGRLTLEPQPNGSVRIDYCTGQYFPTEYRRAVCAALSSALWDYWRDNTLLPSVTADRLRDKAKKELGRTLAARWFN